MRFSNSTKVVFTGCSGVWLQRLLVCTTGLGADSDSLDEIVVERTKTREQSAKDVPIANRRVSRAISCRRLLDLQEQRPIYPGTSPRLNVTGGFGRSAADLQTSEGGSRSYDFPSHTEGAICGVRGRGLSGIAGHARTFPLFDVTREVHKKGPQGTMFGH